MSLMVVISYANKKELNRPVTGRLLNAMLPREGRLLKYCPVMTFEKETLLIWSSFESRALQGGLLA